MKTRNDDRFPYLQRGSEHQPVRDSKESHVCAIAAESKSPDPDYGPGMRMSRRIKGTDREIFKTKGTMTKGNPNHEN